MDTTNPTNKEESHHSLVAPSPSVSAAVVVVVVGSPVLVHQKGSCSLLDAQSSCTDEKSTDPSSLILLPLFDGVTHHLEKNFSRRDDDGLMDSS